MSGIIHNALVAIAGGGTGGHLFPALAVAEALQDKGVEVVLFVSPKEVDREAVQRTEGLRIVPLDAVGWDARKPWRFLRGVARSWRTVGTCYRDTKPGAVLAMGGFTSVAPILQGRRIGARTYLHESNAMPGRANRWLAPWVDGAFVGFASACGRLRCPGAQVTGTPVRAALGPKEPRACRRTLGLDESAPTVLVMGGSQGASGVNRLMVAALPWLKGSVPGLQVIHLAGHREADLMRRAYAAAGVRCVVHGFYQHMELVLAAADAAVSRAGAASLAELAALRLPAVLVPYPFAADNHQWHNAREFVKAGAARMVEEREGTGASLSAAVEGILLNRALAGEMRRALAGWHQPGAAEQIASVLAGALHDAGESAVRTVAPLGGRVGRGDRKGGDSRVLAFRASDETGGAR